MGVFMNKILTPSLIFVALFLVSCGKNDNNSTVPIIPPYGNPIYSNPVGTPLEINGLRTLFETANLDSGVVAGDYFDKVEASNWGLNLNVSFFGRNFSTSTSTPVRYTVSSVSASMVEVTKGNSNTLQDPIDRPYLLDLIFSENQTNYTLVARRGCIQTLEEGSKPATVIEKIREIGGGLYLQPNYIPIERVVVSSAVPLYLNPVSIETGYRTKYIRRYKSGSRVINITQVGNCGVPQIF